jgi:Putative MetA-pathway of phenol degradation
LSLKLAGGIILGALILLPVPVEAARPLDTEDAGTVEPGAGQLELGGTFARSDPDNVWLLIAKLAIGVLPGLEVSAQTSFLALDVSGARGEAGLGDSNLRVKYRVLDETPSLPALLAAVDLRLPTADSDLVQGDNDVDLLGLAVASKTFGPVTLMANGGYLFFLADRDLDLWLLTGAIEYRAGAALSLVAELVSLLPTTAARNDIAVVRAGLAYGLTDRIKLDGAVGFGLTRGSPDVTATVGITVSLF